MSFHNVQLNPAISFGTEGGPEFATVIQATASGHEYRFTRRSQAQHAYRFDKRLMEATTWHALLEFYFARRGHLHGFRFKDHRDFSTAVDGVSAPTALDEVIGTGDGTETDFQFFAEYDPSGLNPYIRPITLPVAGSVLVAVDGTPTGSFSVTNPGGVITLATPPGSGDVVTAGCYFDVPVRFDTNEEQLRLRLNANADASLGCIEILNEVETPELWYPGGSAAVLETGQDFQFTFHNEFWPIDPTADVDGFLPPPDRMPGGNRILVVHCVAGASNDVTVRDDAGNSVAGPLSAGDTVTIALMRDGSTATWVAF